MAGSAIVQTQNQTVQVLGPAQVRDVMEVGFSTVPHNVYAVVKVPLAFWKQFGSNEYVEQVASLIEAAFAIPGVVGATYTEDVDDAGLLVSFVDFTVSIDPPSLAQSGPMVAIARVPLASFTEPIAPLDAIRQPILDTTAALMRTATE